MSGVSYGWCIRTYVTQKWTLANEFAILSTCACCKGLSTRDESFTWEFGLRPCLTRINIKCFKSAYCVSLCISTHDYLYMRAIHAYPCMYVYCACVYRMTLLTQNNHVCLPYVTYVVRIARGVISMQFSAYSLAMYIPSRLCVLLHTPKADAYFCVALIRCGECS